jgi:hypothetical protein
VKLEASEAGTGLRILVEEVKQTEALLNATQLSLDAARAAQGSGLERKEALVLEVISTPCLTSVLSNQTFSLTLPLTSLLHLSIISSVVWKNA